MSIPMRVLAATMMCGVLGAWSARAGWEGTCEAAFAVKATMDSFVGKAESEPVAVADGSSEVRVTVPIAGMETGKKKRDAAMRQMFEEDRYPRIEGLASLDDLRRIAENGELPLTLSMHGQTRELIARVSGVEATENRLVFDAAFDVSLKEFGLKPPSIMKLIRVGDVVNVTAHLSLAAAQP